MEGEWRGWVGMKEAENSEHDLTPRHLLQVYADCYLVKVNNARLMFMVLLYLGQILVLGFTHATPISKLKNVVIIIRNEYT